MLTAPEVADILSCGLSIFTVWESWGGADFPGRTTEPLGDDYFTATMGLQDATRALAGAKSAGQPQDTTIYFAVDYDCTDPNVLTEYFKTVYGILKGKYRVGTYGSYRVTRFAGSNWPFVPDRWLTYAWSGGLVDGGAEIYQYSNDVDVNGYKVDLNESSIQGWGQDLTPEEVETIVRKVLVDDGYQNFIKAVNDRLAIDAHHKHISPITTTGEPV